MNGADSAHNKKQKAVGRLTRRKRRADDRPWRQRGVNAPQETRGEPSVAPTELARRSSRSGTPCLTSAVRYGRMFSCPTMAAAFSPGERISLPSSRRDRRRSRFGCRRAASRECHAAVQSVLCPFTGIFRAAVVGPAFTSGLRRLKTVLRSALFRLVRPVYGPPLRRPLREFTRSRT